MLELELVDGRTALLAAPELKNKDVPVEAEVEVDVNELAARDKDDAAADNDEV